MHLYLVAARLSRFIDINHRFSGILFIVGLLIDTGFYFQRCKNTPNLIILMRIARPRRTVRQNNC